MNECLAIFSGMAAMALAGAVSSYSSGRAKYRAQMEWTIRNNKPAIADTHKRKNEMWIGTSCPQGLLAHSTIPMSLLAFRESTFTILQSGRSGKRLRSPSVVSFTKKGDK